MTHWIGKNFITAFFFPPLELLYFYLFDLLQCPLFSVSVSVLSFSFLQHSFNLFYSLMLSSFKFLFPSLLSFSFLQHSFYLFYSLLPFSLSYFFLLSFLLPASIFSPFLQAAMQEKKKGRREENRNRKQT